MSELYYSINWDHVINIGMFLLGSMFLIVGAMKASFDD
jgi:hypothetical protein